jgi:hypothetical protein
MKIRHILAIGGLVVATLAAGSINAAADEMSGDRHDGGMRNSERNGGNSRGRTVHQEDRRGDNRHEEWHGGDWHGPRGPWHSDFRHFDRDDYRVWRDGSWHRSWHDGRYGWWWIASGEWFFYPQPVYPYPDPNNYVPLPAVVVQPPPPEPLAPQPQQYWYYCDAAQGYYPYVTTCPSGWRAVPAAPPSVPAAPAQ